VRTGPVTKNTFYLTKISRERCQRNRYNMYAHFQKVNIKKETIERDKKKRVRRKYDKMIKESREKKIRVDGRGGR
jgi:thymidylate kinase